MLTRYHFNVAGESNALRFTAAVWAYTPEEAVELLNAVVDTGEEIKVQDNGGGAYTEPGIEYLNVYGNGLRVSVADIDETSDEDTDDDVGHTQDDAGNRRLLGMQNLGSLL